MWISLYFLIAITSIIWFPEFLNGNVVFNDRFWIPKEMAYVFMGFIVIALSKINKKKRVEFSNSWLSSALVFCSLSYVICFYIPLIFNNSDGNIYWNFWNFRPTMNIVLGFWLIQTLVENTDSVKRWIDVSKFLCWCGFIFSVYAILQWVGVDPIFRSGIMPGNSREVYMVTFFGKEFLTSNYIAMISPLCLMFKEFRYKLMYVFMILAVLLSKTLISIIAVVFALLIYLILTKKFTKALIALLFFSSLSILWFVNDPGSFTNNGRFQLWKDILSVSINTAFTGTGIGSFGMMGFKSAHMKAISAHNEFLQFFQEGGIPLLIISLGYIFTLCRRFILGILEDNNVLLVCYFCAFSSFVVVCLAGFPLRIAPLALLGILYIACLEYQLIRR